MKTFREFITECELVEGKKPYPSKKVKDSILRKQEIANSPHTNPNRASREGDRLSKQIKIDKKKRPGRDMDMMHDVY